MMWTIVMNFPTCLTTSALFLEEFWEKELSILAWIFLAIYYFLQSISWILQFENRYSRTVWKWKNHSANIFFGKNSVKSIFSLIVNHTVNWFHERYFKWDESKFSCFPHCVRIPIFTSIIPSGGASQKIILHNYPFLNYGCHLYDTSFLQYIKSIHAHTKKNWQIKFTAAMWKLILNFTHFW